MLIVESLHTSGTVRLFLQLSISLRTKISKGVCVMQVQCVYYPILSVKYIILIFFL